MLPRPAGPWIFLGLLLALGAVTHAQTPAAPPESAPPASAPQPPTAPATPAAPEEVTFRFNPPLGVPYLETLRTTTTSQAAHGKGVGSLTETVYQVVFRRAPAQQLEQARSLVSMKVVQNERPLDLSRLLKVMQGQELVLHATEDGRYLSFSGGANLLERARQVLPAEAYQAMRPRLDDKELATAQRAEWINRVEYFAGKTLAFGHPYVRASRLELADGRSLPVLDTLRLVGRARTADCDCLRLEITSANAPDTPAGTTVTGRGTALIDAETSLLWSQTVDRTVRTKSQISEGFSVPVTLQVKGEYTLEHTR
jgi:hypothetical protein